MKIQFLKSATTIVESNGVKILTDPWLVDGEYYGSWFHYPPYSFEPEQFSDIDFIYLSHIHPDHFSRSTLAQLPKTIPVLLHSYDVKFLKRNVESLGFKTVELAHNTRTHLKNGVYINILAADNCDPELCQKFFGCGLVEKKFGSTQIDSLCVIDDTRFTLANINDCPIGLAQSCAQIIRETYDRVDFLFVGYAGAGPYPQCFDNLDEDEVVIAAQKKKAQFLDQGKKFIELFQPRYFMPFAGTYTLGGSLAKLNPIRGVPEIEEALSVLDSQTSSHGLLLNTDQYFDLESESASAPYTPVDLAAKSAYVRDVLAPKPYPFESQPLPTLAELETYIPLAYQRMNQTRESIRFVSETKVVVRAVDEKSIILSMDGNGWEWADDKDADSLQQYVRFSVDPRLLLNILKGPKWGHWNNAEIGSHIRFYRSPERFERGLYYCMNFFFAGPLQDVPAPHSRLSQQQRVQLKNNA